MIEFCNKNENRNYPFSSDSVPTGVSGDAFPSDVFVDAILYPMNPAGDMTLSVFDASSGQVVVSDGTSEFSGVVDGNIVELWGSRHVGTIICGSGIERELASGRKWKFKSLRFAASCVVPVVTDCVTGLSVQEPQLSVSGTTIGIVGDGRLVSSVGSEEVDGGSINTFRIDVTRPAVKAPDNSGLVTTLVVAVYGKPKFDVTKIDGTSAAIVGTMSVDDVCYQANLKDEVAKVTDTCDNPEELRCIKTPSEFIDVSHEISGCSVSIQAIDLVNHRNPVKISSVGGSVIPAFDRIRPGMLEEDIRNELSKSYLAPTEVGNGLKIEIPGASTK